MWLKGPVSASGGYMGILPNLTKGYYNSLSLSLLFHKIFQIRNSLNNAKGPHHQWKKGLVWPPMAHPRVTENVQNGRFSTNFFDWWYQARPLQCLIKSSPQIQKFFLRLYYFFTYIYLSQVPAPRKQNHYMTLPKDL